MPLYQSLDDFLNNIPEEWGKPGFDPIPLYNKHGDQLEYAWEEKPWYGKWVDFGLTLHKNIDTDQIVGFTLIELIRCTPKITEIEEGMVPMRHLVELMRDNVGKPENRKIYDDLMDIMPVGISISIKELPMDGEPLVYSIGKLHLQRFHEFRFPNQLECHIMFDEGCWTLHTPVNYVYNDQSVGQLFEDLIEELRMLWDEYATEDDEKLTGDAQKLKQQCLRLMYKVQRPEGSNETTNIPGNGQEKS